MRNNGSPLSAKCPRCGASNEPGEKFCGDCGIALGTLTAPSAKKSDDPQIRVADTLAERKIVTALFADMKGPTELMHEPDPEEARAIVDPALKLMIDVIRQYDVHIVQSAGDGIFMLFGVPLAHEDYPQRALYAALRNDRPKVCGGIRCNRLRTQ